MKKQGVNSLNGSCYCTSIGVYVHLPAASKQISPRRCDCSFCVKHGASYFSDPLGALEFRIHRQGSLKRYRQTAGGTADFLLCETCGVLLGVIFDEGSGLVFGAVNANLFERGLFAEPVDVSPRLLTTEEKIGRWKALWFPTVINDESTRSS